jgi:hypothetical protein
MSKTEEVPMGNTKLHGPVLAVLVIVVAGALTVLAGIPGRTSVLESQVSDIKSVLTDIQQTVHEIRGK